MREFELTEGQQTTMTRWAKTPRDLRGIAFHSGLLPLYTSENLISEWERQAQSLTSLGLPQLYDMSDDQYQDSLPTFEPASPSNDSRYSVPLLVDPKMPLFDLEVSDTQDIVGTPRVPYVVWTDQGTEISVYTQGDYIKWDDTKANRGRDGSFSEGQTPCTLREVVFMAVHHPELPRMVSLLGSARNTPYRPCIRGTDSSVS